jgi:hypothetical protein
MWNTPHPLEEDVDTCPHQVGWVADQSATRPTWLGIGLPVQFQLRSSPIVVPSMIQVSYIWVSKL